MFDIKKLYVIIGIADGEVSASSTSKGNNRERKENKMEIKLNANITKSRTLIIEYKTLAPFFIEKSQFNTHKEYFENFKEFEKRAKEIIDNSTNNGEKLAILTYEIKFYGLKTITQNDKEERILAMKTNLFEFDSIKEIKQWLKYEKKEENGKF